MQVTYTVIIDLAKETGTIPQCDISMGKAVAHLTGTYDAHGQVTSVNLKLNGQGMPVDDLEAMLPALGVVLPPKSQLKGGDLNTDMTIAGPVDKLVTVGNVKMENSTLANFNLGSKLSGHLGPVGQEHRATTPRFRISAPMFAWLPRAPRPTISISPFRPSAWSPEPAQ